MISDHRFMVGASVASLVAISGCGGGSSGGAAVVPQPGTPGTATAASFSVGKAVDCRGTADVPELALQGQVPAALRQAGFKGFKCNFDLVGQYQGEGGNWSAATFTDGAGRTCFYHATAAPVAGRQTPGVPVIDITDAKNPTRTASLTTPAMLNAWESLRVNARRQILIADNGATWACTRRSTSPTCGSRRSSRPGTSLRSA